MVQSIFNLSMKIYSELSRIRLQFVFYIAADVDKDMLDWYGPGM